MPRILKILLNENTLKTKTIQIKSVTLTKDLLRELCEVIDEGHEQFKKENENNISWIAYELEYKDNSDETDDSKTFLKYTIPPDFKKIRMVFHGGLDTRIEIEFWSEFQSIELTLKSSNKQWRNSIIQTIEDIFEKYENKKNEFFHKTIANVVYFGIPFIIAMGITLLVSPYLTIPNPPTPLLTWIPVITDAVIIIMVTMTSSLPLKNLFHRLYPKIEIENSKSVKIRKAILFIIGTITLSVIGSGTIPGYTQESFRSIQ